MTQRRDGTARHRLLATRRHAGYDRDLHTHADENDAEAHEHPLGKAKHQHVGSQEPLRQGWQPGRPLR